MGKKLRWGRDIGFLFRKLIINYYRFFHGDYVNSDGRRLLEEILRMIMYEHPEYKRRIYKIRRDPSLYNILKLGEDIVGPRIHEWVEEGINSFHY
ncbi:hypothetical protein Smar_0399 [Staphylothermus marinus F1]|uniref:Uncharacterized protein n=1 Tax=Staphylothermus marinus (strain ATCC 43588 / DSM 3639 / JCM 9404 / F1) TaxID=399550 RepID=A3DLK1_STAMF|nr:hypothetical protein [Staphylothermus marinus]ABN69511.1 hypothetical protein Smar_0399 [Staphylothermus marinus F1]